MLDSPTSTRATQTTHRSRNSRGPVRPPTDDQELGSQAPPTRPASSLLAKRGLRIGKTRVGKGLFATKRIVDGSCIGEIQGEVIDDDDYVSRYSFDLTDGQQLEPDAPFRFVNHSCDPNCAFECFSFPKLSRMADATSGTHLVNAPTAQRKLLLFAICDIAIGQELTIDYNWPAIFAIPCGCRAISCRGWIVTPRDLPQLLEQASPA